jgi:hypothetical protein
MEYTVPYLMGKGETVSCRPLIVDKFVNINDVQITGNKSFDVKGLLKILDIGTGSRIRKLGI